MQVASGTFLKRAICTTSLDPLKHKPLIYKDLFSASLLAQRLRYIPVTLQPMMLAQILRKTGVTRMKKFAIAAATATALTLTMANVAMAQTSAQAPMTVAANEVAKTKEATSDTWITTKVKSDLLTEKGIPGSDIKVETNKGVVSLSSTVAVTESQKTTAVAITKKIKGVKAVSADGLKAE
jgi:hyperosmotically inducible protein